MTRHHPYIHTMLLGLSIQLGRLFNNDNLGLFIYSLIQVCILSSTLAYSIKFLKKHDISKVYRFILLLIYNHKNIKNLYIKYNRLQDQNAKQFVKNLSAIGNATNLNALNQNVN